MKIRKGLGLLSVLPALMLASLAPAKPPAAVHVAQPGLWKLADADTTIYLFGTIHALPKDYVWESPELKAVIAHADELVIETVIDRDPQKVATLLFGMGKAAAPSPILDRVPPAKRTALQGVIARSGLPIAVLDQLKTWAAGVMLTAVTLKDLGLDPESGVEEQLKAQFAAQTKPIAGLEKPEQQLGYLDSLPEADQRAFLGTVADDPAQGRKDFAAMLASWSHGDEKRMARAFDKDLEATPKLRVVLLDQRNANWTNWLADRLKKPGTILVAVGAGHLAGPNSVQAKLAARGLKAVRVE